MGGDNRTRILEAIRLSRLPLDDDELSRRTGISPRQTVNQACRAMERAGVLRRVSGPDGKIVNVLNSAVTEQVAPTDAALMGRGTPAGGVHIALEDGQRPPGSSHEQRAAERIMLDLLGDRLGLALEPGRITVPSGARVEIDGVDPDRRVLVECWAHQGAPKVAQKHKVLADAFKLTWIASTLSPRPRLILCLADPLAAAPFQSSARSWSAQALQDQGVMIELVELPGDVRAAVSAAQTRQYR